MMAHERRELKMASGNIRPVEKQEEDYALEMTGIVTLAVGGVVLLCVLWPGMVASTIGGGLTGAGSWLLKKGFGK
jgi:hypothetical protein